MVNIGFGTVCVTQIMQVTQQVGNGLAGTGTDSAPYFRIFNPITQGEKFDPQGSTLRDLYPN